MQGVGHSTNLRALLTINAIQRRDHLVGIFLGVVVDRYAEIIIDLHVFGIAVVFEIVFDTPDNRVERGFSNAHPITLLM